MITAVGRLVLLLGLVLALAIMASERLALNRLPPAISPEFLLEPQSSPPWAGLLAEDIRRTLVLHWRLLAPDAAAARLLQAAEHYPLDAELWMSLARLAAEPGGLPDADLAPLLEMATASAPRRGSTHFEAAQMAMLQADFTTADAHLRNHLAQSPTATRDVLVMASRWHDSQESLVTTLLPANRQSWDQAMRTAWRDSDEALAVALWAARDFSVDLEDSFFLNYIDTLLRSDQAALAAEAWRAHDTHFADGGIANGDFGRPLGSSRGFNWRQNMPDGARLFRDPAVFQSSPASLRILFDGTSNVRLSAPTLQIPVAPNSAYILRGYWRADSLTTRSLPYLQLRAGRDFDSQRIDPPETSFEWTPWEMHFQTTDSTDLVRLSLQRDQSREFDRDISGMLWIDSLRLERIGDADPGVNHD